MFKFGNTCKLMALTSLTVLMSNALFFKKVDAQSANFNNSQPSTNNGSNNLNEPLANQNNAQNKTEFNVPNIYPLNNPINTPVNTENDFGFNMSAGVNTLDSNNVTVFLGVVYHPGRSEDHKARMNRLRKETEYLETQKQATSAQLQVNSAQLELIQKQIAEAELRLQKLRGNLNENPPSQPTEVNPKQLQKQMIKDDAGNIQIKGLNFRMWK
jgi:hypothetical protein